MVYFDMVQLQGSTVWYYGRIVYFDREVPYSTMSDRVVLCGTMAR